MAPRNPDTIRDMSGSSRTPGKQGVPRRPPKPKPGEQQWQLLQTPNGFWHRLLAFLEHPLFLWAAGIIGGMAGLLLWRPVFTVLDGCLVLALHRSRAIADKDRMVQTLAYIVMFLVVGTGLVVLGNVMQQRARELLQEIIRGVSAGVNTPIPARQQRTVDPKYPVPGNKLLRFDGQVEPPSSQMCLGLADAERIACLCPRPATYSLEPLATPSTDNYAAMLSVSSMIEPMNKIRVFLRAPFSMATTTYPTEEMGKSGHFSILHGFMDYDRSSFFVQSSAPQELFKIEVRSSMGPRVICVNQEN